MSAAFTDSGTACESVGDICIIKHYKSIFIHKESYEAISRETEDLPHSSLFLCSLNEKKGKIE